MTTTEDLTTLTPVEIDTQIAALYQERYRQQGIAQQNWAFVSNIVGILLGVKRADATSEQTRDWLSEYSEISESEELQAEAYPSGYDRGHAQRAWVLYHEYLDAATAADEVFLDVQPLDEEYIRRGRWNRAFLVTNGNGHVHSSMNCSTCRVTTQYHWVVDFSDHGEAEIVEAAGERACTVCYPSAPVGVKGTTIFTPDEQEKARAREEREAKRAAKAAAEITVPDYRDYDSSTFVGRTFKSERAVTNAIANELSSLCWYGTSHPSAARWIDNANALRRALEAKTGEPFDWEAALVKARKKVTREPKF